MTSVISEIQEGLKNIYKFEISQRGKKESYSIELKKYREKSVNFSFLFDDAYYLEQMQSYGEELGSNSTYLEHYLQFGYEKYNPNKIFDTRFYLHRYGGILLNKVPLIDYIEVSFNGEEHSRDPSTFINTEYAKLNYGLSTKECLLFYILKHDFKKGVRTHPFFDLEYLQNAVEKKFPGILKGTLKNVDKVVSIMDLNLLADFDPSPIFSNQTYKASKEKIVTSPFYDFHFEEPEKMGNPNNFFSTSRYVKENKDVPFHFINPYVHFLLYKDIENQYSSICNLKGEKIQLKNNLDLYEKINRASFSREVFLSQNHLDNFKRECLEESFYFFSEEAHLKTSSKSFNTYQINNKEDLIEIDLVNIDGLDAQYTVDIWDTLLIRTAPPLNQYRLICDYIKSVSNGSSWQDIYDVVLDSEENFTNQKKYTSFNEIFLDVYKKLKINKVNSKDFLEKIEEVCFYFDTKNSSLNRELYSYLEKLDTQKVQLLSDYHYGKAYLKKLLAGLTGEEIRWNINVSVDFRKTKHFGHIYPEVKKGLNDKNHWIHIGDNHESDFINAKKYGANSILFSNSQYKREKDDDYFSSMTSIWAADNFGKYKNVSSANIERLGTVSASQLYSVIPVVFLYLSLKNTLEKGGTRIYLMSREGRFLYEVYLQIKDMLPPYFNKIECAYLPSSRRALFPAAFSSNENEALNIFKSQYSEATLGTFIKAVFPSVLSEGILNKVPHEILSGKMDSVGNCLELKERIGLNFYVDYLKYSSIQSQYLKNILGPDFAQKNTEYLCDLGWRGTMQEMLGCSFRSQNFYGNYLGLFPALYSGPYTSAKEGIIFNSEMADVISTINPPGVLERLLTPNIGTVVAYSNSGYDDIIVDSVLSDEFITLQNLIIGESKGTLNNILNLGMNDGLLKDLCLSVIKHLYLRPTNLIANTWFDSIHDDTYGLGAEIFKKDSLNFLDWDFFNPEKNLAAYALASGWSNGYKKWGAALWYQSLIRAK